MMQHKLLATENKNRTGSGECRFKFNVVPYIKFRRNIKHITNKNILVATYRVGSKYQSFYN